MVSRGDTIPQVPRPVARVPAETCARQTLPYRVPPSSEPFLPEGRALSVKQTCSVWAGLDEGPRSGQCEGHGAPVPVALAGRAARLPSPL